MKASERDEPLHALKARFAMHGHRHPGLALTNVLARLEGSLAALLAGAVAEAVTLEDRVQALEKRVDGFAGTGLVLFLYGSFCALWAQRAARSSWGWFFFGLFLGPIAAVVLLHKNAQASKAPGPTP